MRNFFILKWLRNVPISRKLYFTVGLMAMLIMIELATLTFAIKTLSSVRALVGAEGLWSKAQKDAAYHLQKYGRSHDEQDYVAYQSFLKVPLGDHKARLELMKPDMDMDTAREGFREGRVHPEDIDGAIHIFRRFHSISYIHDAIAIWTKGDSLMAQFIAIGDELHTDINAPGATNEKIETTLNKLGPMDDKLTKLEDDFSYTLGEGSRWLEHLILRLLFGLVLTVEVCGLSLTILVSRGISKGLNEIIGAADKIAKGDLTVRAARYSSDEIGILATAFNEMTRKLEKNINALMQSEDNLRTSKKVAEESIIVKENFLANMSHEIRTPMNAVMGFTSLLEQSNLTEEQHAIVHSMKISGETLMTLINDILDYSKLESGKIVIEQIPFSVRNTFESLEVLLQQKAKAKNLALIFDIDNKLPETLKGDPTRLMQILLNLTDNAIKFTETGHVEISVSVLGNEDKGIAKLEFKVKDTGKGIAPDKTSIIFERFTQESAATTRKYGGSGLGLSIVKGLVELQKGSIALQSTPGLGSVFSFVLSYPIAKDGSHVAQKTIAPATPASFGTDQTDKNIKDGALSILIVEDNTINQMLAVHVLKKFGMITEIAENGRIGVEKLREKKYDLVLMDIQMPEMDGYEATAIIRNELKNNVPIVALTAHNMNKEREKCLGLGMNDFISKPFDPKHLQETIIRLCAQAA